MNQSTLIWGLILILGFPLFSVTIGEIIEHLQREGNPLARFLHNIRTWLLPPLAILLLMDQLLGIKSSDLSLQVVETALGLATIYTLISLLNAVLTTSARKIAWQIHVPNLLFQFARSLVIISIIAYVLSNVWNVNLSKVVQALGVGSLVIALALQDTLSNLVSGFLLIFESPLKVGDWVKFKDLEGEVVEINWRAARLKTRNQGIVIVPNGILAKDIIYNYTMLDQIHADRVYISFWREDSPNRIQQILKNTALATKGIVSQPPPDVRLISFEGYATKYEVMFYINDFAQLEFIRNDFMTCVHHAARRNGLNIAVPTNREFRLDGGPVPKEDPKQKIMESLQTIPYFRSLERSILEQLTNRANLEGFAIGEEIVREGDLDTGFYIILNGSVRLSAMDWQNREQEVARLSKDDFFGEMVFWRGEASHVSVTVIEDLKTIRIAPDAVSDLANQNHRFALEMNQFVEQRRKATHLAIGTNNLGNLDTILQERGSHPFIQQLMDLSDN